jgi:hypothetical protein
VVDGIWVLRHEEIDQSARDIVDGSPGEKAFELRDRL